MVGTIVHQLTRNISTAEIKKSGFDDYYTDHRLGVYPQSASGTPFSAAVLAVKGDPIADLNEDLAAEQKARATYENLIRLADDPDVIEPLKFLRAREIVHYQRFGETLRVLLDDMGKKKIFAIKPSKAMNIMSANVEKTNMEEKPIMSAEKPMKTEKSENILNIYKK